MIRRPPRSTHCISSAASDVYKRQPRQRSHTRQGRAADFERSGRCVHAMPTNLNPNATPFNPHAPVFVSSSSSTNLDFPPLSRFNGGQPFSVGAPSADDSSQSAPAAPPDDVEAAALDNDVATLVSLGLRLADIERLWGCLLYTSPSPRDRQKSRMPSSA